MDSRVLIATGTQVLVVRPDTGAVSMARGLEDRRPTCLAASSSGAAWCGTRRNGVLRSEDGGGTWLASGLDGEHVMSVAASPVKPLLVWAGTEPSALFRSEDSGHRWDERPGLTDLPSSSQWSFPPRPDTHHVRWIACHPRDEGRLWLAIEAGALVSTPDGGRTWLDRVEGGPWDTHEVAIHRERPDTLRIAAGDGYFESHDGGSIWGTPGEGLEVGYLRSVAVDPGDPEVVVVSAASHAHAAYVVGRSDGRLYRREGESSWTRIRSGWPDPPDTLAPLLAAGTTPGELWAADERGLHHSVDGGCMWERVAAFDPKPRNLRGLAVVGRSEPG